MRAFEKCLIAVMLATCAPAMAQFSTQACTDDPPNSSYPTWRTCLQVNNYAPLVGDPVQVLAWLYNNPQGGFNVETSFTLYDGTFAIATHGTTPHGPQGQLMEVNIVFTSVGTVQLRADPAAAGRLDTPPIAITVRKFEPAYAQTVTPTVALAGQSVTINTSTTLHRPNGGVLAFYVTPPGVNVLNAVEFTRKTVSVTGPGRVTDTDTRNFAFVAPYNVPGEYIFQASYLGDGFNNTNRSEYKRVKVGPYPTSTALTQSIATSVAGKPVTLTATITPAAGGISAPAGNVEFLDGTTLLGTVPLASGSAVLVTTQLRVTGNRSLTARYVGDVWNLASTSPALAHTTKFDPAVMVPIIDLVLKPPQL